MKVKVSIDLEDNDMEIDAINSISKPKIPKAYSYVLRSGQLNEFLKNNSISIHIDLVFWLPQTIGTIFEAHYWLANGNIPYPRLYIRAGALPKRDIQTARVIMSDEVFPRFGSWFADILKYVDYSQSPSVSPPYFNAIYKDNKITIMNQL